MNDTSVYLGVDTSVYPKSFDQLEKVYGILQSCKSQPLDIDPALDDSCVEVKMAYESLVIISDSVNTYFSDILRADDNFCLRLIIALATLTQEDAQGFFS